MLNRPRTWEAAARYAQREVSSLIDNDDVTEMRLGLSYYYRRHNLKFQVDAGQLETQLGDRVRRRAPKGSRSAAAGPVHLLDSACTASS